MTGSIWPVVRGFTCLLGSEPQGKSRLSVDRAAISH